MPEDAWEAEVEVLDGVIETKDSSPNKSRDSRSRRSRSRASSYLRFSSNSLARWADDSDMKASSNRRPRHTGRNFDFSEGSCAFLARRWVDRGSKREKYWLEKIGRVVFEGF